MPTHFFDVFAHHWCFRFFFKSYKHDKYLRHKVVLSCVKFQSSILRIAVALGVFVRPGHILGKLFLRFQQKVAVRLHGQWWHSKGSQILHTNHALCVKIEQALAAEWGKTWNFPSQFSTWHAPVLGRLKEKYASDCTFNGMVGRIIEFCTSCMCCDVRSRLD